MCSLETNYSMQAMHMTSHNDYYQHETKIQKYKPFFKRILQLIHAILVIGVFTGGVKEFIDNPPFFDAYGDAKSNDRLPSGIFQNDPHVTQAGNLRLLDMPIITIVLAYVGVCIWLKFRGLSWLLTFFMAVAIGTFCIINYWASDIFMWKYYSTRMSGLELQVSTIALAATSILVVVFYTRKRFPFKFKSSLPIMHLGVAHVVYNIVAIYLVMFTTMVLWFTKMYTSWACFRSHQEIMQICQITTQVQCYMCDVCTFDGIKQCAGNETSKTFFSCNMEYPVSTNQGAFCIFNYNMSAVEFITIFAYIGGLCVFLSVFIRLAGHYILRVIFLIYSVALEFCNKSSETLTKHQQKLKVIEALRAAKLISRESMLLSTEQELNNTASELDIDDSVSLTIPAPELLRLYDSDNENNNDFLDASCA